ncbi:class I SAM-dependent methyltransferase [Mesorhizobium sp.]|uniref:class I SAM-dependent methyltransferase n=1 Tax=Mesorhizobium sp. TaxID=1871066 RepID=UPI0025CBB186|nr:class I SAM-dependent methyltransferase [Mesorhizobium sp.]
MDQQQPTFDPVKFKETTRKQWDGAAEAWNRWGPLLSRWLGPATELMLDMTDVKRGSRVLDVAAGAGEQTSTAARRVGPEGYVLATDISAGILDFAASNRNWRAMATSTPSSPTAKCWAPYPLTPSTPSFRASA